jgi:hypothetical protein
MDMKNNIIYRDWRVYYIPKAPVTGKWQAYRFGIRLCANSRAALESLIADWWDRNEVRSPNRYETISANMSYEQQLKNARTNFY